MRSALFWDITQRTAAIPYRDFGTTSLRTGAVGCPETSVWNCHTMLRNIPEERRSHLHRGGSLSSRSSLQI